MWSASLTADSRALLRPTMTGMARRPKLGSGKRFKALRKKGVSPALAAYIGRKKFGTKRMSKLSATGRRRAARRRKR